MKKILFIVKNPLESSFRFRVKEYLPYLEQDFACDIFYAEYKNSKVQAINSFMKRLNYLRLFFKIKKYDIVYMQRPMSSDKKKSVFFETLLTKRNPNLFFDFDDALFLQNKQKIDALIRLSKVCVCGNDYLASYAKGINPSTYIVPTSINMQRFKPKSTFSETLTLGWTGTSGNYQFYSPTLIAAIKSLLNKYDNLSFLFICDRKPNERFDFDYAFIPWKESSEIEDLQKIDIGIMPLDNSEWSKGKCGFKLIQYGGIGIASVASNVGVNGQVILDQETGLLVNSEDEWETAIESLILDAQKRKEYGQKARLHIEKSYSIHHNYVKLKEILETYRKEQ